MVLADSRGVAVRRCRIQRTFSLCGSQICVWLCVLLCGVEGRRVVELKACADAADQQVGDEAQCNEVLAQMLGLVGSPSRQE